MSPQIQSFDSQSALSHHCGICSKPLNHPSAKMACIGHHEVICQKFHPMFHFIGQAHSCKACTNEERLQDKRLRAIGNTILKLQQLTGTMYPLSQSCEAPTTAPAETAVAGEDPDWKPDTVEAETTVACEGTGWKLSKRERKEKKRVAKAQGRGSVLTLAGIAQLGKIMYPDKDTKSRQDLYEAISKKWKPTMSAERGLINSIISIPKAARSYEEEAVRVVAALHITEPLAKSAKSVYKQIIHAIIEDMESSRNGEMEMMRRRASYANWISNGAVERSIRSYEGFDFNTGLKLSSPVNCGPSQPSNPGWATAATEAEAPRFGAVSFVLGPGEADRRTGGRVVRAKSPPPAPSTSTSPIAAVRGPNLIPHNAWPAPPTPPKRVTPLSIIMEMEREMGKGKGKEERGWTVVGKGMGKKF